MQIENGRNHTLFNLRFAIFNFQFATQSCINHRSGGVCASESCICLPPLALGQFTSTKRKLRSPPSSCKTHASKLVFAILPWHNLGHLTGSTSKMVGGVRDDFHRRGIHRVGCAQRRRRQERPRPGAEEQVRGLASIARRVAVVRQMQRQRQGAVLVLGRFRHARVGRVSVQLPEPAVSLQTFAGLAVRLCARQVVHRGRCAGGIVLQTRESRRAGREEKASRGR